MKNEYLAFEDCLDRLNQSFVRKIKLRAYGPNLMDDFVDFQHPSLRDMLYKILENEPQTRRLYISRASHEGLSYIITALAPNIRIIGRPNCFMITNQDELTLLCSRIESILFGPLTYSQLSSILGSADLLIPRREDGSKFLPSNLDMRAFVETFIGRVLSTIENSIADHKFYSNHATYPMYYWTHVLERFYEMASYVIPLPYPCYTNELIEKCKNSSELEQMPFLICLAKNEPQQLRCIYNEQLDDRVKEYIILKLKDSYDEGKKHEDVIYNSYDDAYYGYQHWIDAASDAIDSAKSFYRFSMSEPTEDLVSLECLRESIPLPDSSAYDNDEKEDKNAIDGYSANQLGNGKNYEYWTFDKLFQDL